MLRDTPSNKHTQNQAKLCFVDWEVFSIRCDALHFEDNEAVIKMIIKGRSPTMRQVSRTHKVAADWLFDRIILDPKIQKLNMSSNTKDQVQGNLSRDTTSNKHTQNKTKVPTQHYNYDLNNINCVPSNAKFFSIWCDAVHLGGQRSRD